MLWEHLACLSDELLRQVAEQLLEAIGLRQHALSHYHRASCTAEGLVPPTPCVELCYAFSVKGVKRCLTVRPQHQLKSVRRCRHCSCMGSGVSIGMVRCSPAASELRRLPRCAVLPSRIRSALSSIYDRSVVDATLQTGRGSVPQEDCAAAAHKLLEGIVSGVSLVSELGDNQPVVTGAWRCLPGMAASCVAQVCVSSLRKASAVLMIACAPETHAMSKTRAQAFSIGGKKELAAKHLHAVMRSGAAARVSAAPASCYSAVLFRNIVLCCKTKSLYMACLACMTCCVRDRVPAILRLQMLAWQSPAMVRF